MDLARIPNINSLYGRLIAEELARLSCDFVAIGPGSRSTPLTAAFAAHAKFEKRVCYDERSLGFLALGRAKATGVPSVLITTSGSAAANLLPAVAEAYQDQIPLIILTADRPFELQERGSNQTFNQSYLFGQQVVFFEDFPAPDAGVDPRAMLSKLDQAYAHATSKVRSGPVHLNCAFRDPLAPHVPQDFNASQLVLLKQWVESTSPLCSTLGQHAGGALSDEVLTRVQVAKRGLIVAGQMDESDAKAVLQLAEHFNWPIVGDVLSQLRLKAHSMMISHFDQILLDEQLSQLAPDVVLQFGGKIVSKRIEQFLARPVSCHVFVDPCVRHRQGGAWPTHRYVGCAQDLVRQMLPDIKAQPSELLPLLRTANLAVQKQLDALLERDLTEPSTARAVVRALDASRVLFVASSMPIRDVSFFAPVTSDPPLIFANRGLSGIDGLISTAAGISLGSKQSVVMLIGDLAFLHDVNGLSLLRDLPHPMTIVLINNQGGGIFSMLPIAENREVFTPYFDAPHAFDLGALCGGFGIKHQVIRNLPELVAQLAQPSEHQVLELQTDREQNRALHNAIYGEVRRCLQKIR